MATVNPVITTVEGDGSVMSILWTLTTANADGAPVKMTPFADRSIQMTGTWGSGTGVLQGSNDGVTWFTLYDPDGSPITSAATNKLEQVLELTQFMRPVLTGSTGATVVFNMIARRANPMRT